VHTPCCCIAFAAAICNTCCTMQEMTVTKLCAIHGSKRCVHTRESCANNNDDDDGCKISFAPQNLTWTMQDTKKRSRDAFEAGSDSRRRVLPAKRNKQSHQQPRPSSSVTQEKKMKKKMAKRNKQWQLPSSGTQGEKKAKRHRTQLQASPPPPHTARAAEPTEAVSERPFDDGSDFIPLGPPIDARPPSDATAPRQQRRKWHQRRASGSDGGPGKQQKRR